MKKLTRVAQKVNAEVIGLDVHKNATVFCRLDRSGDEVESGEFASRAEELCTFLDDRIGRKKTHVVLEASRSSLWVYSILEERYGRGRVHLAQANKIRAIANSKSKNDFNDAWWLAYLTHERRLPEAHVPEKKVLELRIATRERHEAVKLRTKVINRLRSHLAQLGKVIPSTSISTKKSREYLIQNIASIPGLRGQAIRSCFQDLEYQDAAIAEWNEAIESLVQKLPAVGVIAREMPGIGTTLAAMIIGEVGAVERFHTPKALSRYTGLTPSDHSTGGKTIHGRITREGSPYLRWALTQAIIGCCRMTYGPGLAVGNWVRAKQKRMGSSAKARAAAARKLAEGIWRLFHLGEVFDLARPFGGARC